MPRSADPRNLFRNPRPYPVFAGSMPSQRGGRRVTVLGGVNADGTWDIQKEDRGAEQGCSDPILFLPFGGIDYALNMGDLKEMLAGMRESHKEWREEQAPVPDMTAEVKNFAEAIIHYRHGRKHFAVKETTHDERK